MTTQVSEVPQNMEHVPVHICDQHAALSWGCKATAEMVTYSRTQNVVLAKQSLRSVHGKQL